MLLPNCAVMPYHLRRADPNGKWFLTEAEGEALLPTLLADEDVALQEMNRHSMQVVNTADMRKMPTVQESSHSYYLEEGRWLDAEDQALANPVCVVHVGFAQLRGLSLGDEITLTLRDLPEAYFGYIISDFQDSWDTYATQSVTLQIVGIYGTLSPNPVQDSYTSNYLYIPDSVMPEGFGRRDGTVSPSSFSFILRSPADKDAFLTETRPALLDLGLDVQFIERDWEAFAAASDALKDSALSGLLLYGALFLTVAAVCAFVYVHQRTKEIAIARALGMGAGETLWGSFVPYALLAAVCIGDFPGVSPVSTAYGVGKCVLSAGALRDSRKGGQGTGAEEFGAGGNWGREAPPVPLSALRRRTAAGGHCPGAVVRRENPAGR